MVLLVCATLAADHIFTSHYTSWAEAEGSPATLLAVRCPAPCCSITDRWHTDVWVLHRGGSGGDGVLARAPAQHATGFASTRA